LLTAFAVGALLAPWSVTRAQTAPPPQQPQQPQQPQLSVAVIDTGTNAPVNVVGGFNFVVNNEDLSDRTDNNHGTTVSLLVDEQAPGIAQYQYVVAAPDFSSSPGLTEAGIFAAAANPDVRAMTISSGSENYSSAAVAAASNANKFVAMRSGNGGGDNPSTLAVTAFQLPGVLIVGATDGAGGVLGNSNACGVTASRCVHTLGGTPLSTIAGTSFASARIAGIAAAVLRVSPFLTAEQLVQVIIASAEDRGDPGVDPLYGQGFVRDAAQVINNPAGPPGVPGDDGGGSSIGAAALVVGAGVGAALLLNNKKKLKKTLVLDSFGRPFWTDLSESARITSDRPTVSSFFDALDERYTETDYLLNGRHAMKLSYATRGTELFDVERHHAMAFDPAFNDRDLDWTFSLRSTAPYGFQYVVNRNLDPAYHYGALGKLPGVERDGRATFISGYAFSSPFLGFADSADTIALGFKTRSGMDVNFGVVNMKETTEFGRESIAAVLEGRYDFDGRGSVSAQFGRLNEAGSLFGGSSGGAFSVDESETYAVSLTGTLQIDETFSLLANYGQGYSNVDDSGRSLLRNFSDLRSDWFGLGLVANRLLNERDQWGVAISQPMRVYDGEVDMSVPYARDFDGNIYRDVDRIGLVPDGREYTLESFYRYRLDRRTSLGAFVMFRQQPDHVQQAASEVTILGTVRMQM
jgi:hypothetical protein